MGEQTNHKQALVMMLKYNCLNSRYMCWVNNRKMLRNDVVIFTVLSRDRRVVVIL